MGCVTARLFLFEGYQLLEAGKLPGSLRLEDPVQFGLSPPDDAAVRVSFPLPQCCHQLPAQDGRAVHAPRRYVTRCYATLVYIQLRRWQRFGEGKFGLKEKNIGQRLYQVPQQVTSGCKARIVCSLSVVNRKVKLQLDPCYTFEKKIKINTKPNTFYI